MYLDIDKPTKGLYKFGKLANTFIFYFIAGEETEAS